MQGRQAPAQAGQQEAGSEAPDQGVEGRSISMAEQSSLSGESPGKQHVDPGREQQGAGSDADKGDRTDS